MHNANKNPFDSCSVSANVSSNNANSSSDVEWNNGWRTKDGKFASQNGAGKPGGWAEREVWNQLKTDHQDWTVIEHGVYTKNAQGQIRIYDGAVLTDEGLWLGIETKSGKAGKTKSQKDFDKMVSITNPVDVYGKSKTKDGILKIFGVMDFNK